MAACATTALRVACLEFHDDDRSALYQAMQIEVERARMQLEDHRSASCETATHSLQLGCELAVVAREIDLISAQIERRNNQQETLSNIEVIAKLTRTVIAIRKTMRALINFSMTGNRGA